MANSPTETAADVRYTHRSPFQAFTDCAYDPACGLGTLFLATSLRTINEVTL